ncbi:DUF2806 domain-containing protein [Stutzerimonas stutzeri]|uniref:DUF2806 domain-containing protein n=1 Tax=Stutzerimonas stutzeri TaxID=316 RepID=UPI0031D9CF7F
MLGEKLFIKMWESLADKGIGSLASPWQIKREGRAYAEVRRDELLLLAQAESDANQIKEGKKKLLPDGRLINIASHSEASADNIDYLGRIEPVFSLENINHKIENQKKAEELQREININKTIILAEEELLRSQQEAPEEKVDPDWIFRWREHAQNTQNEELRKIWARTLAGEIKSPGSYSFRTLEFIKNLSQKEAVSISKLGQFAIANTIFKCDRLEAVGIDFGFLLEMDDLGILIGVQGGQASGLELTMKSAVPEKFYNNIVNRNLILLVEGEDPNKTLKLGCYQISKIGTELLSLGDFNADAQYMKQIGLKIKEQGFEVKLASWLQTHATHGQYFNAESL